MPRTVSASEAKNEFGGIMAWAQKNKDDVIVENRGQPNAVIMSFEAYKQVLELREKARREDALARLERLRARVRARNQDLTDRQAEAIAGELSREAVEKMIQKGKISYQGE